ncbi:heavy metal translocating P-type ATPase [Camelimonas abortus]|uniref:Heavy metal translocating P-type ATPase n=1 Tax=Camelimonas abortus TaxID=1017184 RepID=A0ABV7LAI3_9HYPH
MSAQVQAATTAAQASGARTARIPVAGMSCASCVRRVEQALLAAPGVKRAAVNLAAETAEVELDAGIDLAAAIGAIRDAGYDVPAQTVTIDIEGMGCASCVGRVERALQAVPGVVSAAVNLAAGRAAVAFIPGLTGRPALEAAIRAAGYRPLPPARQGDGVAAMQGLSEAREAARARETAGLKRDLIIAAALTLPVSVIEMGGHFIPAWSHWLAAAAGHRNLQLSSLVLTTLTLFGPGLRFFVRGVPALLRGAPDMNALVAVGAGAAWAYSAVATLAPQLFPEGAAHVYFEAAAVIVTLVLLGRFLEARARGRAGDAIRRLVGLQPRAARVMRDGEWRDVPLETVGPGDEIQVRPGERIPLDGLVISGRSQVDESMISGEPVPVAKEPGAEVTGGSLNQAGAFVFRVTRTGDDTVLAQIIRMVETAQGAKLPIEGVVDRITMWFVPAVMAAAALTFAVWLFFGPQPALALAVVNAVSVLIIACPCAMGLATPMSIMVAAGRAAELGVLFRNGEALQTLAGVRVIAFDKTGTLTAGRPALTDLETTNGFGRAEALRLAAAVEAQSEHHLAAAITEAARREGIAPPAAGDFAALPGRGVSATVEGRRTLAGSAAFLGENGVDVGPLAATAARLASEARSTVYLAVDGRLAAVIAVADPVRPTTQQALETLRAMGVRTAMISGDSRRTAEAVAAKLGISDVAAETLPDGKVAALERLRAAYGPAAFVGDGVNDAPALAAADVGIAVGAGADIAIESADVALMTSDPAGVAAALALSRAAMANIRQNLFWAFAYNAALIPVAAGALYPAFGVMLSPMLGAGAMALSSLFVVGNALRLRRFTPPARAA